MPPRPLHVPGTPPPPRVPRASSVCCARSCKSSSVSRDWRAFYLAKPTRICTRTTVQGRRYKDDGLAGLRQSCEKRLTVIASVVFEGFLDGDGDTWVSWDNAVNRLLCFRDGGAYGPCSKQRSRPTPAFRRALSFVSWNNRRTVPRRFAPSHASRRGGQASAGRVRALGILERPARKGASPARHARSAEASSRLGVLRVFRRPCAWPASRVSRDWSVASRFELGMSPFVSEGRALACSGRRSPCDDAGDSCHVI